MSRVSIAAAPVDIATLRRALERPGCGGFCLFEGWVRETNDGRQVSALDYEAYAELALSEGERIIDEAVQRFGVADARCMHRVGRLAVSDTAVWIGVVAPHRDAAFRACRCIIDEIKQRLPIWKKEHYLVGASSWVACSHGSAHDPVYEPEAEAEQMPHTNAPSTVGPDRRVTKRAMAAK
jgi:molybdopterin synthase catalytic subunit